MEEEISDEFMTELLNVLEDLNNKAQTSAEHELMFEILKTVNETIEFTD
jgi:hypothetical protein